jgi:hypothetical protein
VITADALNRARRTVVVVPRTTGPTRDRLSSSPRPRLGQIRWRFVTKSAQWTSIVSARVEGGFRPKICDLSKMACGASLNSEQRRTRADRIKPRDREPSKTVGGQAERRPPSCTSPELRARVVGATRFRSSFRPRIGRALLWRTYHEPICWPRFARVSEADAGNCCRSDFSVLLSPVCQARILESQ